MLVFPFARGMRRAQSGIRETTWTVSETTGIEHGGGPDEIKADVLVRWT